MATFPDGKRFAFTVFDDTDFGTVENLAPVYSFLVELGFRTTKSVWPLAGTAGTTGGDSLEDPDYLRFVLDLRDKGFEIALHNVQDGNSTRERTQLGIRRFQELVGAHARTHCNHSQNRDNLYWGEQRFSFLATRVAYLLGTRFRKRAYYQGHVRGSEYFWGDINPASYTRNFVFDEINLDRINPSMPYQLPGTPYVPLWFSGCEGGDVASFCRTIAEPHQDRLETEGGVCIMYTHFAGGFTQGGSLHPRFAELMTRLARKDGWFVPVSDLMEHLIAKPGRGGRIPPRELWNMELRWLLEKRTKGTS